MEISFEMLFDGDTEKSESDFKWTIKETSAFFYFIEWNRILHPHAHFSLRKNIVQGSKNSSGMFRFEDAFKK